MSIYLLFCRAQKVIFSTCGGGEYKFKFNRLASQPASNYLFMLLVCGALTGLCSQRVFASSTRKDDWISQPAKDTSSPGVGYLNNSDVIGIWGTNSALNSPVLVVTPDQSVGIGITNPSSQYKLSVDGPAIFTKIKVKLDVQFPDYVFHKSYKLPSLDSVEQFIKNYHHLPDVPSAQKVATDDLDVGTQQVLLLKKIEELTLYVIEQHKQLAAQRQKIEALEEKLGKR